jgi:hypothetical protein
MTADDKLARPNMVDQHWAREKVSVSLHVGTVGPLSTDALYKLRAVEIALREFMDEVR